MSACARLRLLPLFGVLVVLAFLPSRATEPQSDGMKTLAKTAAAKKPARKLLARRAAPSRPYGIAPRALPVVYAKAGELNGHSDEVGKNADWEAVAAAYESRAL